MRFDTLGDGVGPSPGVPPSYRAGTAGSLPSLGCLGRAPGSTVGTDKNFLGMTFGVELCQELQSNE